MKITTSPMIRIGLYCLLIIMAAFAILPFVWMSSTAVKSEAEVFLWPPSLIPKHIQWQNFVNGWTRLPFNRFFLNTLFLSVMTTGFTLFAGSTAGFVFAKYDFPAKRFLFFLLLSFLMVPGQVTVVPSYLLVRSFGWVNTYAGLIVPGLLDIFGIFLVKQFLHSIPNDLFDAARIDGCHDWRIYLNIVLPLIKPALAVLAIFTFTGSWNAFLWPLVIADDIDLYTLQVGIAFFTNQAGTDYPIMMAVGFVSLLPVIIIYILFQRYFVSGIALTGMKG